MVGRPSASAVILEASSRCSRAEAPGCAQTCPSSFYAALQAPGVASGGTRGRALRALKQKTGPSGAYGFPPLRGGTFRFSACPALSPVCFLGPATAAPKGMDR